MLNIAINSFRELFRNRILILILVFAFLLIAFSVVLSGLSLGQTDRIILDFGIAMIEFSSLLATLFVGGQILFREIDGKTIYLILSKPIDRYAFILGKFIGFSAILLVIMAAQFGVLIGLLLFEKIAIDTLIFSIALLMSLKLLIVFALILFFSTFSAPLLTVMATLWIYVASHATPSVMDLAIRSQSIAFVRASEILSVMLPNFAALALPKNTIGGPIALSAEYIVSNGAIAVGYLCCILGATIWIFSRKKFETI